MLIGSLTTSLNVETQLEATSRPPSIPFVLYTLGEDVSLQTESSTPGLYSFTELGIFGASAPASDHASSSPPEARSEAHAQHQATSPAAFDSDPSRAAFGSAGDSQIYTRAIAGPNTLAPDSALGTPPNRMRLNSPALPPPPPEADPATDLMSPHAPGRSALALTVERTFGSEIEIVFEEAETTLTIKIISSNLEQSELSEIGRRISLFASARSSKPVNIVVVNKPIVAV